MSDSTNVSESSHIENTSPNPVQALFESAYEVGENVVNEVKKGGGPICGGIAKRIEENPGEAALEGAGFVAAGALVIGGVVAESPVIIGAGGALALTSTLGVGAYESLKQIDRLGKEWSKNGENPLDWGKIFRNHQLYDVSNQKRFF